MDELLGFDQVKVLDSLVGNEAGRELFKQSLQEILDDMKMAVGERVDSDMILERVALLKNLLQRQEAWLLELRGRLNRGGLEVIGAELMD